MINAADKFYSENNLQDLNVMGNNLTKEDLEKIKTLNNVTDAERKLVVTGIDADDNDKTYLISFIESNNISKFYVITGEEFDANKKGVWVDNFYAEKNNLNVGDTIKIQYDSFILEEKILGLINVPDHIYDVKDESELVPNRNVFGFVYLSYNSFTCVCIIFSSAVNVVILVLSIASIPEYVATVAKISNTTIVTTSATSVMPELLLIFKVLLFICFLQLNL